MHDAASGGPDSKRNEEGSATTRGVMNRDEVLVELVDLELLERPEDHSSG